ncbi:hypothetical protein F7725_016494, partial [Dissostichus mawsoni]
MSRSLNTEDYLTKWVQYPVQNVTLVLLLQPGHNPAVDKPREHRSDPIRRHTLFPTGRRETSPLCRSRSCWSRPASLEDLVVVEMVYLLRQFLPGHNPAVDKPREHRSDPIRRHTLFPTGRVKDLHSAGAGVVGADQPHWWTWWSPATTQLSTNHVSIVQIPSVVTHCSPRAVVKDLDSAGAGVVVADQPNWRTWWWWSWFNCCGRSCLSQRKNPGHNPAVDKPPEHRSDPIRRHTLFPTGRCETSPLCRSRNCWSPPASLEDLVEVELPGHSPAVDKPRDHRSDPICRHKLFPTCRCETPPLCRSRSCWSRPASLEDLVEVELVYLPRQFL